MQQPSTWYVAVAPIDLRCGVDRLLVFVQQTHGAVSGSAGYVFRNRAGSRIKVLLLDATGVWLCVRRLHAGRFHWPNAQDAMYTLSAVQFHWLCTGVEWMRLSAQSMPTHAF